jgi:hypothetical protein
MPKAKPLEISKTKNDKWLKISLVKISRNKFYVQFQLHVLKLKMADMADSYKSCTVDKSTEDTVQNHYEIETKPG